MTKGGSFDYTSLPPEERKTLEPLEGIILQGGGKMMSIGLVIGEAFLIAKATVSHGTFQEWCRLAVNFEPRRAERYMDAAKLFRAYGDDVRGLEFTSAQDLGASSVGEDTINEVLARVRRGERVTVDWVKQTINRDKSGSKRRTKSVSPQSIETAAMIAEALDLSHCRRVQEFLRERPSAPLFITDLADRIDARLAKGRPTRAKSVTLSLPAA